MKPRPFSFRLDSRRIVNLSLASYLLTLAMLLAIRYAGGVRPAHGAVPVWAWWTGLAVPGLDLLLGLEVMRNTRRLGLARPLLLSACVLGLFAAWTLWTWR